MADEPPTIIAGGNFPLDAEVFAKQIRKGTAVSMLGRPESVEPIMPLQARYSKMECLDTCIGIHGKIQNWRIVRTYTYIHTCMYI